jgi:large subunit ribosomal protein L33
MLAAALRSRLRSAFVTGTGRALQIDEALSASTSAPTGNRDVGQIDPARGSRRSIANCSGMPVAARNRANLTRSPIGHFALAKQMKRDSDEEPVARPGITNMSQEIITLECTEAKAAGAPVSRYMTTRNKKSPRTPNRLEKKKYNPFMKRHTLHRETK